MSKTQCLVAKRLSILNKSGLETLGGLDIDGLDVGVKLLGGALLVVTLAGDADAESEWASLDTGLPDLLVQLWVDADISGTLFGVLAICRRSQIHCRNRNYAARNV